MGKVLTEINIKYFTFRRTHYCLCKTINCRGYLVLSNINISRMQDYYFTAMGGDQIVETGWTNISHNKTLTWHTKTGDKLLLCSILQKINYEKSFVIFLSYPAKKGAVQYKESIICLNSNFWTWDLFDIVMASEKGNAVPHKGM